MTYRFDESTEYVKNVYPIGNTYMIKILSIGGYPYTADFIKDYYKIDIPALELSIMSGIILRCGNSIENNFLSDGWEVVFAFFSSYKENDIIFMHENMLIGYKTHEIVVFIEKKNNKS